MATLGEKPMVSSGNTDAVHSMTTASDCFVVALEEHYLDLEIEKQVGRRREDSAFIRSRLQDVAELRLAEMDEAGIDLQILSHVPPGAQGLQREGCAVPARSLNDRLAKIVETEPTRFAAFASLPTRNPAEAADELERCVTRLGFKGAMIHGLTDGRFIDEKTFWPIFERAQALDVPIYVHPGPPDPRVVEAYYKAYVEKYPAILTAGWGFTVETATSGLRLILSGVFDAYPELTIILGHMGEGLPFLLWRMNHAFTKMRHPDVDPLPFRDIFCDRFFITTSGNFSDTALLCSVMEMGADRVMFSVDWPFVDNRLGTAWMERIPLSDADKRKILSGNAIRLLKLHTD